MTPTGREQPIHQASKMNTQIALRKAGVGQFLPIAAAMQTSAS